MVNFNFITIQLGLCLFYLICFRVCLQSYEDCGFAVHVCLSIWNNLIPAGWILMKFFIVCVRACGIGRKSYLNVSVKCKFG